MPVVQYISYTTFSPSHRNYLLSVSFNFEPLFYHQAIWFDYWKEAMATELAAMELKKNTWSVIGLPKDKHSIDHKWVYKIKYKLDGSIDKYKALFVAKGYTQQVGLHFIEIFFPVAKLVAVKILLAIAAIHK